MRSWWQRTPHEVTVPVPLPAVAGIPRPQPVPSSGGLILHAVARPVDAAHFAGRIPPGTRSVSLFLVNGRRPSSDRARDEAFAFQAEIVVRSSVPFVPRPDPREVSGNDWDERVADLHYAHTPEYAAGHGVSADWTLVDGGCRVLRTTWTPAADVEKTETFDVPGVELDMHVLGSLPNDSAAEAALTPLVTEYRSWVGRQRAGLGALAGERLAAAQELLRLAGATADRMERGIRLLVDDPNALEAFRAANRAVAAALARRLAREGVTGASPRWRSFQLAFILLNLPGIADPTNPEREFVDLLFFPTGGGKTEAYLGLAAFTMVLRRLRNPDDGGRAGAGVSVIMRYTLRLLTLDQLGRAAGLICALELERRRDASGRLGDWPFEIGLWVGKAGTPQSPRGSRGRAFGLRPQQGQPVQVQPARQTVPHSNRELPVVRRGLHPGILHPAAGLGPADRSAHHVRKLAVRIFRRRTPPHRRRGRAALPALACVPHRHRGQVRLPAMDRGIRRTSRWRGPVRRRRVLRSGVAPPGRPSRPPNPAARSRDSGRAAPHLRPSRHHGRPLRDGDRGALRTRNRRAAGEAENRRFDRHRPPCPGSDPGALRAARYPGLPAARAGSPGLVLRPHDARIREARADVPRIAAQGRNPDERQSARTVAPKPGDHHLRPGRPH